MVGNFVKFSQYSWATQSLEMCNTTGHMNRTWWTNGAFGRYIKNGDFKNALQKVESVGQWEHSSWGHDYWNSILCTTEW